MWCGGSTPINGAAFIVQFTVCRHLGLARHSVPFEEIAPGFFQLDFLGVSYRQGWCIAPVKPPPLSEWLTIRPERKRHFTQRRILTAIANRW
jgi:hypothetical protein